MLARNASHSDAGGPKNPTIHQRINWHMQHALNCNCRPIPQKLLEEIEKRKIMLAC
ncbi:MAG TPA: hypothetical protein VLE91_00375 [Candidatus Saccharimonadales bacterium]|nr:hypothetical protein [Candidatus Saccharimonadales bacterium]